MVSEKFDSHNSARWIEALVTTRVNMRSEACPPRGEHKRFCPHDLLRRVDFIRALAELQRWEVSAVASTHFADMETGSPAAQVAEYMWQQGYLPATDIDCPADTAQPRFCPTAAVMMGRALGLVKSFR